jgi:hypothetical protein
MKMPVGVLLVLVACLASRNARADITLQPTDVLQISFTTLAAPDCSVGGGPCNTLIFLLDFTNNVNDASIATAELFDSSTLLGTFQTDQACLNLGTCSGLAPSFAAAGSIFGLGSPEIDFTSILNGTIHGVLDVTVDKPIGFDPDSSSNFFAVTHAEDRGVGDGGYFKGYDSVSVLAPAPEPSLTVLLGVCMASLVARRYRKKAEPR